jgi:HAD-hyrolase-like
VASGRGYRVLLVGDSLTTDIEGARAAGYDSLFVARGILSGELGIASGESPTPPCARAMASASSPHSDGEEAALPSASATSARVDFLHCGDYIIRPTRGFTFRILL